MLVDPETKFCLITSFDQAKLVEAEYFFTELRKGGYHINSIIMNRSHPEWLNLHEALPAEAPVGSKNLFALYKEEKEFYACRERIHATFAKKHEAQTKVIRLPDINRPISDLLGLEVMAEIIRAQGDGQ